MGKKDVSLKEYFREPHRYADIWNGGMFQGKQLLRAEELLPATTEQVHARKNGETIETLQDIVMQQTRHGQILALWVVENQEETDYSMPARMMLQEALRYHEQVSNIKAKNRCQLQKHIEHMNKKQLKKRHTHIGLENNKDKMEAGEYLYRFMKTDKLIPVITMVVYWSDKEWEGPRTLHEMLQLTGDNELDAEILKLVPEYPLHLVNLASLEHTEYFKTELRLLLELYRLKDDKTAWNNYIVSNDMCREVDKDTYKVLNALTHATGLEKEIDEKEDKVDMCRALFEIREDAKAEGREEGREEGQFLTLCKYVKKGIIKLEDAAADMNLTKDEFLSRMEAII